MQVIGAGFGRTGTMSLQAALELLGYRCYHMREITKDPSHLPAWHAFVSGTAPMDWNALFAGYKATIDFPPAFIIANCSASFPTPKWS